MKFLLVDPEHKNPFILKKIQDEGHEVLLLTDIRFSTSNLYPLTHSPEEALEWSPDVALFTPGLGQLAHHFYSRGIKVLGGGLIHDTFYEDPEYVSVLASRVRVPICPIDNGGHKLKAAGLFSKTGFIGPALSYAPERGLYNQSGRTEALFLQRLPDDSQLVRETFLKLEKALTCVDFCGWVFLDIQIDPETEVPHIHSLSVEVPEGFYPAFLYGLDQPLSKLLSSVANRKKGFKFTFKEELIGTAKVTIPPYPLVEFPWLDTTERLVAQQLLLRGAKGKTIPEMNDYTYWVDVHKLEDRVETTGPVVGWVAGSGTWEDLTTNLEIKAASLLPEAQYKVNLSKLLRKDLTNFSKTLERPLSGTRSR